MTTAIFIRSYHKDFEWLAYCLRSIQKYATGFSEIVIAVPQGQETVLRHLTAERVVTVNDAQPGYLAQQVSKLTADLHSPADFILHMDSDCVFTRPVTPDTFLHKDKPVWLMTPWNFISSNGKLAWFHVMCKCLQQAPEFEYMRRNAVMVPRFAYSAFREFIQSTHGMPMDAYVMNQPNKEFTEWNCLGFFLHTCFKDSIHWHDTSVKPLPESCEFQGWSWGGLTPEIRANLEEITR